MPGFDRTFRDDDHPLKLGERIELTGLTIEITALTEDGRPAEAAFRFATTLEDPSFRWVQWKDGVYVPFAVPAVAQTIALPPAAIPF